jgi:hypothetical protein
MPNVAGREFPYTPQGMAAAEQYRQSLGMRGGGMMGFRPVGYDQGGEAVNRYREGLIDQILSLSRNTSDSVRMALRGQDTSSLEATLARLREESMQGSPVSDLPPEQRRQLMELPSQTDFMGRPITPPQERPSVEDLQQPLGQSVTENPGYDPQTGGFFPPERRAHGGIMSLRR